MAVVMALPGNDLSLCIPDLKSKKKDAALAEMALAAEAAGLVTGSDLLLELLRLRERLGNTAVGKGVAIPHARSLTVSQPRILVARSARGIDWQVADEGAVHLVLLTLAPAEWSDDAFHALLARAAGSSRLQRTRQKLLAAPSPQELALAFREALA
ncbi:MAG: PTS sugar transporter subunit IIA [Candidatus Eisenbacteria bacterium]|uniref:PTS sugar transporter subunit IIA n=1 Tax=Eiseniibacteriota bacterium TaxID=2212470 RepID=A0A538TYZ2_UNCEI|nr:MAG: PTS sugar transporter subunit IIA [Candidatus Eisenbacteria bacterium]